VAKDGFLGHLSGCCCSNNPQIVPWKWLLWWKSPTSSWHKRTYTSIWNRSL